MSDSLKQLKIIRFKLMSEQPFFGSLLYSLDLVLSQAIPTAATDGKRIMFNEEFSESLSMKERIFVMCHELLHVAYDHTGHEWVGFEKELLNVAMDMRINTT